jgi:hypothetical protein
LNLTLKVGTAGSVPSVPSDATAWRDYRGKVAAYCFTVDGDYWMSLPGVGSFRFSEGTDEVTSIAEPGASPERVRDAYLRGVLPMALQALGLEVLHASAVRIDHEVVALCAVSQTGKSTVAYALSRRGHRVFADDAVAYDLAGAAPRALPLPFELHLRPESASFFGVSRLRAAEKADANPAPLRALCILERAHSSAPGGPVHIRRLAPAAAFSRVLTHAYCFSLEPSKRQAYLVERYLQLVSLVPVLEVRLWPGLENLERAAAAIEHAVQRAA